MNISMNKSVLRRAAQQMAEQLAAALPEEERTASADGFEAQAAQLLHQEEYRRKGRWGWRRGIAAVLAAMLALGTILAVSPQAQAAVSRWFRKITTAVTAYCFPLAESAGVWTSKAPAQMPGGYVLDQPGYDFSVVYEYIYGNLSYVIQNDYYIFPDSDARYLSNADIQGMSAQELCYGKNEIYARHGRTFRSLELTDYFATKSWYYGSVAPADFNSAVFNTYENNNIKFLTDAENALTNGNGYVLDQPGYNIYAVGISDYYYDDDRLENDFIFYDSDTRYLTDAEVKGLSLQVVCYAKNEIYARRGRIFDSQELNDYFYSKPWYYGRILPEDFSSDVFNKYELANITLLDGYERALAPNGYQLY